MLCEICKKNPATTYIEQNINGKVIKLHLCEKCAKEQGINDFFSDFSIFQNFSPFESILGSFFGDPALPSNSTNVKRCEGCGMSYQDIVNSGKVGCSKCYETFYDMLLPTLQRIHGKTRHVGKQPVIVEEKFHSEKLKLKELQEEMKSCIKDQNFEKAAKLRDEISSLEKKINDDNDKDSK